MRVQGIKALRLKYRVKSAGGAEEFKRRFLTELQRSGWVRYDNYLINYNDPSVSQGMGELLSSGKVRKIKVRKRGNAGNPTIEVYALDSANLKDWEEVGSWKSLPARTKASRSAVVKVEGPGTDGNYYVCIYGKRGTQSFDKEHFKKKFRDLTAARQYARELATQQYQAFSIQPLQVEDTAA